MTKEEFNKKWPMSKIPDAIRQVAVSWGDAYGWFIEDKVKLAQDILEAIDKHISEVSKQQSILFAKWVMQNCCQDLGNPDEERWSYHPMDNEDYEEKSSEELWQLFLSQQKQ